MFKIVSQMRNHVSLGKIVSWYCYHELGCRWRVGFEEPYEVLAHKREDEITEHPGEFPEALGEGDAHLLEGDGSHHDRVYMASAALFPSSLGDRWFLQIKV